MDSKIRKMLLYLVGHFYNMLLNIREFFFLSSILSRKVSYDSNEQFRYIIRVIWLKRRI